MLRCLAQGLSASLLRSVREGEGEKEGKTLQSNLHSPPPPPRKQDIDGEKGQREGGGGKEKPFPIFRLPSY